MVIQFYNLVLSGISFYVSYSLLLEEIASVIHSSLNQIVHVVSFDGDLGTLKWAHISGPSSMEAFPVYEQIRDAISCASACFSFLYFNLFNLPASALATQGAA